MIRVNWDEEFANARYIPDGGTYPSTWATRAAEFRTRHGRFDQDVPYGTETRQAYDLFWPADGHRGLAIFLHGGYWMEFDKSYWSHLANGLCGKGWVFAIPNYVLAPQARIFEITRMVASAIEQCSIRVDGPIVLLGHSAGGHLVTRMVCANSPLQDQSRDRVKRVVSISGLHDLRNLAQTQMNDTLQLDEEEAIAESPALALPWFSASVLCWVGALERPEFIRQAEVLRENWEDKVQKFRFEIEPHRHHFDVVESLTEPTSSLVRMIAED